MDDDETLEEYKRRVDRLTFTPERIEKALKRQPAKTLKRKAGKQQEGS